MPAYGNGGIQILPNGQWIDTSTGQIVAPGTNLQGSAAPVAAAPTPGPAPTDQPAPAPAADQAPPAPAPATDQATPQATPDQTPPQAPLDYQSVANQAYQALIQSKGSLDTVNANIQNTQQQIAALPGGVNNPAFDSLNAQLTSLYNQQYQANQNWSLASDRYTTVANQAINSQQLTPAQVQQIGAQTTTLQQQGALYGAQAQQVGAQTQLISQGQLPLTQAQAGLTQAQTGQTAAQTGLIGAQTGLVGAQAGQVGAQTGLTQAQTGLTGAQAGLTQAQAAGILGGQLPLQAAQAGLAGAQAQNVAALTPGQVGLQGAQTQLAGAQGVNQLAGAAGTLAQIQAAQQGPLFGLQDRINLIRQAQQAVFGPGGSGNPDDANNLLQQYVQSAIGGTTPYQAATTAAQAAQNQFGTQASLYNAAQGALASRANALTGLGGSILGTLGQMNANAPAGSTALAGAFRDVMNYMAGQTQSGALAPPTPPTPPAMPSFLQAYANPSSQQQQPININIGGAQPQQAPAPAPAPQGLPNVLQGMSSPTPDFVHQLWGNELGSGQVTSPYGSALPPNTGPGPGTPTAGSLSY
jgi:hypothetical protein